MTDEPLDPDPSAATPIDTAELPAPAATNPAETTVAGSTVCPYLGLRGDPRTHYAFPSSAQVCHADGKARSIDAGKQARDCLTAAHTGCRYFEASHPEGGGPGTGSMGVLAAVAATEPVRPSSPRPGRDHRRSAVWLLGYAALLLAIAVIGLAIGGALAGSLGRSATNLPAGGGATPAPAGSVSPAPTLEPIPTMAPTARPVVTPSPGPTPVATPSEPAVESPTPTPRPSAAAGTHKVKRGETLTTIAFKYGVTVKAIQKANGIEDPNRIVTGQVLVIPKPKP